MYWSSLSGKGELDGVGDDDGGGALAPCWCQLAVACTLAITQVLYGGFLIPAP